MDIVATSTHQHQEYKTIVICHVYTSTPRIQNYRHRSKILELVMMRLKPNQIGYTWSVVRNFATSQFNLREETYKIHYISSTLSMRLCSHAPNLIISVLY